MTAEQKETGGRPLALLFGGGAILLVAVLFVLIRVASKDLAEGPNNFRVSPSPVSEASPVEPKARLEVPQPAPSSPEQPRQEEVTSAEERGEVGRHAANEAKSRLPAGGLETSAGGRDIEGGLSRAGIDEDYLQEMYHREIMMSGLSSLPRPELTEEALDEVGRRLEASAQNILTTTEGEKLVDLVVGLYAAAPRQAATQALLSQRDQYQALLDRQGEEYLQTFTKAKELGLNRDEMWENLRGQMMPHWLDLSTRKVAAEEAAKRLSADQ